MESFKKIFFSFIIIIGVNEGIAQQSFPAPRKKIDSLLNQLGGDLGDSSQAKIFNELSEQFWYRNAVQSRKYAENALQLALKSHFRSETAKAYFNLGTVYWLDKHYALALRYTFKSLRIWEELEDEKGTADAYNNIGLIYAGERNYFSALAYHYKALKKRQVINDNHLIGISYNNIGHAFFQLEDYEKAIEELKKGIEFLEKDNDELVLQLSYEYVGEALFELKKYDESLEYLQKSLKIVEKYSDSTRISLLYITIGKIYLQKKELTQAQFFLNQALEIAQKTNQLQVQVDVLQSLGTVYLEIGDFENAKKYSNQALILAHQIDNKKNMRDVYQTLFQTYYQTQEYKQAFDFQTLYLRYNDTVFNEEKIKILASLEAGLKIEEQEKEIQEQKKQNEILKQQETIQQAIITKQYAIGTGILISLIASVITLIFLFRNNLQKRKANEKLTTLNVELEQSKEEILTQRDFIIDSNKRLNTSNKKLHDSLLSAQAIQEAILPPKNQLDVLLNDYFIINRPKDVVSGDFYWAEEIITPDTLCEEINNCIPVQAAPQTISGDKHQILTRKKVLAVVDCTGHGVPGALMSTIGNTLLDKIVLLGKFFRPAKVLSLMNMEVRKMLDQKENPNHFGMSMGLIVWEELADNTIAFMFSGAKRPLYYMQPSEGVLHKIKGDRKEIGGSQYSQTAFSNKKIILEKGTRLYLFSDGFADQNDSKRKKFGNRRLQKMMETFAFLPMDEQKERFELALDEHQRENEQRDDILFMGIVI